MKLLIKLFLLAAFAIIVFVPIRVEYEWVIWLLFILMFALVALYYMLTYWISVKGILKAASAEEAGIQKPSDILFTTFSAKVPGDSAASELIRGRLVVTADKVLFFSKQGDAVKSPLKVAEELDISMISAFTAGKLLPLRKGITFIDRDDNEYSFLVMRYATKKPALIKALGWNNQ